MQIVKAVGLTKTYQSIRRGNSTDALRGIDLTVDKGEFVGIMGASGSGKTTLLNMLSGIDKPTTGEISVCNNEIHKLNTNELALFRRKRLGFVFQEFNLLDSLTLGDNIILPMLLDQNDENEMERRQNYVMELLGIKEILNKYPYEVSGGQQQRAAICRAIINEPEIIYADEPTGNLDSQSSKKVMEYFEKLNVLHECTVLMVTHDAYAASYCRRIVFIQDGKIVHEIVRNGVRKEFLNQILQYLFALEGERDEF